MAGRVFPGVRAGIAVALVVGASAAVAADQGASPAAVQLADLVVVHKAERTLTLYAGGRPLRVFRGIQLGENPVGPKHFQGDGRTPEGRYRLDWSNPRSAYHLSMHVSYPDAQDRAFAAARGRDPGGSIMVHGQPNGWARQGEGPRAPGDWTDGCIALGDDEIEELWRRVSDGTPIEIDP